MLMSKNFFLVQNYQIIPIRHHIKAKISIFDIEQLSEKLIFTVRKQ